MTVAVANALVLAASRVAANRQTGCWEWLGPTRMSDGRPLMCHGTKKDYAALYFIRELAPELLAGPGERIRRTCPNPRCVNPAHFANMFWVNVVADERTGCWEWRGFLLKGYGRFHRQLAHRASYEHFHGPIPDGLTLDHLCRNSVCVNPAHLDPVPQAINNQRRSDTSLIPTIADAIGATR